MAHDIAIPVPGLRGEPDDDLPGPAAVDQISQDVGRPLQLDRGGLPLGTLLEFDVADPDRPEIGDCRAHGDGVSGRLADRHRLVQLGRGLDTDDGDAWGIRHRDVRRHQGHFGAAGSRGLGQRQSLAATGSIAQEPDRVDGFASAPG